MIRLYNTLTRKKEEFQPLEPGHVKMYVCGPTVYSDAHIGHAMSSIVFDIIRRYFEYRGYTVKHVMNYTDVDDKIINRANTLGVDPQALAESYIQAFRQDGCLDAALRNCPQSAAALPGSLLDELGALFPRFGLRGFAD